MDYDQRFFKVSFTSCYKNTEYSRSKIPDTWWSLPENVGFTKSVLKSLNLIFSHVNFVYKIRKWNVPVNILFSKHLYGYKSFKKFYKTLKVAAIFLVGISTCQTFNILRVREYQQKNFVTFSRFWLLKESLTESVKQGKFVTKFFFPSVEWSSIKL